MVEHICQLPTSTGPCGRVKHQWTKEMHPVCIRHDRLPCHKCHAPLVDGNAAACPSCRADVRLGRRQP